MAVSGKEDVVTDVVIIQVLKRPVPVCDVGVPGVYTLFPLVVLEDTREDDLVANNPPGCAPVTRLAEALIEPFLLAGPHQTSARVVPDQVNIVVVPSCLWLTWVGPVVRLRDSSSTNQDPGKVSL